MLFFNWFPNVSNFIHQRSLDGIDIKLLIRKYYSNNKIDTKIAHCSLAFSFDKPSKTKQQYKVRPKKQKPYNQFKLLSTVLRCKLWRATQQFKVFICHVVAKIWIRRIYHSNIIKEYGHMSTKAFLASVFYSVEMLCLLENNWKIRQLRKKKKKMLWWMW